MITQILLPLHVIIILLVRRDLGASPAAVAAAEDEDIFGLFLCVSKSHHTYLPYPFPDRGGISSIQNWFDRTNYSQIPRAGRSLGKG